MCTLYKSINEELEGFARNVVESNMTDDDYNNSSFGKTEVIEEWLSPDHTGRKFVR